MPFVALRTIGFGSLPATSLQAYILTAVDTPPKISEIPAKEIALELVPPRLEQAHYSARGDSAPVHALSALILAAVDSLWAIFDWVPPIWILAIPACFVCVFVPVFLIQKYLKGNTNGRALTFAMFLGILAALPTPIMGTPVGLGLLAWTGLGKLWGKTAQK